MMGGGSSTRGAGAVAHAPLSTSSVPAVAAAPDDVPAAAAAAGEREHEPAGLAAAEALKRAAPTERRMGARHGRRRVPLEPGRTSVVSHTRVVFM